ncbi:cartilage intermediate layer protein 1-like [Ruditapes philippinarum]|uniref:cartilage intermediate layer protein 1-like n=1 Tax=Ruditapes philippinarum TaxID=129788 RepID=UPI00295A5BB1|nr:cartilage intermediate layer protein 1-like [Ruditapes philippinarum]
MDQSFANKNKRYRVTRGNSIASLEKGNSFTNITAQNGFATVKKAPAVPFKFVIALIVFGVIAVVTIVTLVVVLTSKDDDGDADKTTGAPDGKTTSRILTTITTTTGPANNVSTTTTTTISTNTTSGSVDDVWGLWGEWTECTSTCDSGIHKRYRTCNAQDSTGCLGDYIETEVCLETDCPVFGKWTTWASWESCDRTCGSGTQSRRRSCSKIDSSDIDCIGLSVQNKACADWECPDCSKTCIVGTLNDDCDTCECDGEVTNGRVCVFDTGNPVGNADFFSSTAPTKLLGQSNSTGFFTLENLCTNSELLVTRSGFVDQTVLIKSDYLIVNMTKQILPYLTETPQTKYRLKGEDATLCCQAKANPPIDYYEWFKDGQILDESLYQEGNTLRLTSLTTSDSGSYQCRANSAAGAIMSPVATMSIKEGSDEFCSDALQQKTIALPDDCIQSRTNTATYEVGECIPKRCRGHNTTDNGSCREDITTCCTTGEADLEKIQCSGYELEVVVVKSCSCGTCVSDSLTISGSAFGAEDGSPLRFGEVWLNGVFQTYTSTSGDFNFDVSKAAPRITLNLKDIYFKQFLPAVKVIEINDQMGGVLRVDIPMIKSSEPVQIDSSVDNTLVAGSSVNNESTSIIQILIPANAFYYSNGTQYSGTVDASLTFLDPTNSSVLENMPGTFEIVDEEGQLAALDSLGVFSLYFEDSSGQPLVLDKVVDFYVPLEAVQDEEILGEIKLWMINTETGVWEYVTQETGTTRRKRQIDTARWIGELDLSTVSQTWLNYDMIRGRSTACFFKIRLFLDATASATVTYTRRGINVDTQILNGNLLTTVNGYMYYPESQCMAGICEENNAFISLYYYGRKGKDHLFAGTPSLGQPSHSYQIIDEGKVLEIQMSVTEDGPFFRNEAQCKASGKDEHHLKFHYGQTNEIFTYMPFFDMPGPGANIELLIRNSQRTWYPARVPEGYRICLMKVRITFQSTINLPPLQFIKLKATSYGGTYIETENFIFGIREYTLTDLVDTTFCIEYKCSGTIAPRLDPQFDYTRVVLHLVYPPDIGITSEIIGEADFVSSFPDLSNVAQLGEGDGRYDMKAPTVYTPELGLYSATSDRLDLDSATNTAEGECRSGIPHNLNDNNPEIGVAVTFSLTDEGICNFWWSAIFYTFC